MAIFVNADIRGTNFSEAAFPHAVDMEGAIVDDSTKFSSAQLQWLRHLEKVRFNGIPPENGSEWLPIPLPREDKSGNSRRFYRAIKTLVYHAGEAAVTDNNGGDGDGGDDDNNDDANHASNAEAPKPAEEDIAKLYETQASKSWGSDLELVAALAMLSQSDNAEVNTIVAEIKSLKEIVAMTVKVQKALFCVYFSRAKDATVVQINFSKLLKEVQDKTAAAEKTLRNTELSTPATTEMLRRRSTVRKLRKGHVETFTTETNPVHAEETGAIKILRNAATALMDLYRIGLQLMARVSSLLGVATESNVGHDADKGHTEKETENEKVHEHEGNEKGNEEEAGEREEQDKVAESGHATVTAYITEAEKKLDEAKALIDKLTKQKLDDGVTEFVKFMIDNYTENFGSSIGKLKAKLLRAAKKKAEEVYDDGYQKMHRYGWFRMMRTAVVELNYFELNKHVNEIEVVIDLVKTLFNLEVKGENLDEICGRWFLLYDHTRKLQCKAGYRVLLTRLWDDIGVRKAMVLSRLVSESQAPYPVEAVRIFKVSAANHLRQNYVDIIRELNQTVSSIRYIQSKKQQVVGYTLSLFLALWIGIMNFFSKYAWEASAPTLGFSREPVSSGRVLLSQLMPAAHSGIAGLAAGSGIERTPMVISLMEQQLAAAKMAAAEQQEMLQAQLQAAQSAAAEQLAMTKAAAAEQLAATKAAAAEQLAATKAAAAEQRALLQQQLDTIIKQQRGIHSLESAVVPECKTRRKVP